MKNPTSMKSTKVMNKKFFNMAKNIPGTTIVYKNLDDQISWTNDYAKKIMKQQSMVGKTGVDLFAKETIELCLAHDAEVIALPDINHKIVTKKSTLILKSAEQLDCIIMKQVRHDKNEQQPKGIIINSINLNQINLQHYAIEQNCFKHLQQLQYNLYFNLIHPLKELLLLNNIMQESIKNNTNAILLLQETKEQINHLLTKCKQAINTQLELDDNEICNTIFTEKTNLQQLLLYAINQFNNKNNNIYISLQLLNNIPTELYIDKYRVYKILYTLIEHLINVAHDDCLYNKIHLICKTGIKTQPNTNKHIFFILEGPSQLFKHFNYTYQSTKMSLIRNFIIQLNCYVELINKNRISYIYINIPM